MPTSAEQEQEALLQFLYMAPVGLVQTTLAGDVEMINPLSAQLLMPLASNGQLDNLFTALADVAPDLAHRTRAFTAPHGKVCEGLQLLVGGPRPGHAEAQVLSLTLLKLDEQRLMAVLDDVSLQVRRERELRLSQAWLNAIVSSITDYALLTLDHQGRVRDWNPGVGRVTGFSAEAVGGQCYDLFYPTGSVPPTWALDRLHDADASGWSLDEGWRCRADDSRYWGSCLIAPLHTDPQAPLEERRYSLVLRDISDRREAHEALRHAVACDHLTGLANRRAFHEAAELELARWQRTPRPLSVVLLDADHFKRINDQHGHATGDAVLRHLAAGLSAACRERDVVARIGGEEFVALLPGTDLAGATALAQRLCDTLAAHHVQVEDRQIGCTVSAGVATMEAGVADIAALLARADQALYAAKAAGRNRVACWRGGETVPGAAASGGVAAGTNG